MKEEILAKISRLEEQGILEYHLHENQLYKGKTHLPRTKPLAIVDIENMYSVALGKFATKHEDYVEPQLFLDTLLAEIEALAQEAKEQAISNGSYFATVKQFVGYWLNKLNMRVDDEDLIHISPYELTGVEGKECPIGRTILTNFLKTKLSEYNHFSEGRDLSKEDIGSILDTQLTARKIIKRSKVQENLKYSASEAPYTQADIFNWAKKLLHIYFIRHGENETVRDEDTYLLLHMLWQIKRKIYSLPISSELIYSYYSLQQSMGKTSLVKALSKPFAYAYAQVQVTDVLDANSRIALCRDKFVVDMIELSKVEDRGNNVNAVANLFKSLVSNTGPDAVSTHNLRAFHTQSSMVEEQTTVFVTTTNVKIATVIQDRDMRRFWEFVLEPKKGFDPRFFWAANSLLAETEDIYRSIDETDPYGYYHDSHPTLGHIYDNCRVIQKDMAKTNALSEWMKLQNILVSDTLEDGYQKVTVKTFTQKFARYKMQEGSDSKAFNAFYVTSILANVFGIEPDVEMLNGVATKYIYVQGLIK